MGVFSFFCFVSDEWGGVVVGNGVWGGGGGGGMLIIFRCLR